MHEECNAHIENQTWDLVELTEGEKAIGCEYLQ